MNTGEMIGAHCMVTKGDLPIAIRWFFNDEPIHERDGFVSIGKMNSRTSSLNIEEIRDKHRGTYKCVAKNKAGKAEIESTLFVNGTTKSVVVKYFNHYSLSVFFSNEFLLSFRSNYTTVPPQIMPFTFGDGVSNFEDSIATQCMITKGDAPLQIKWFLNDEIIWNDMHLIQLIPIGPKLNALRIDSLNEKHRGNYTCQVQNRAGVVSYSAELVINGDF